jgi:DNA-binding SARP family transcriptional activator
MTTFNQYRILGPLSVIATSPRGEAKVAIAPPLAVRLLVVLLTRRGTVVSVDALVDALWGWDAPVTARHSVHALVSRLRVALGAEEIRTDGPGYIMERPSVDIDMASALVGSARDHLKTDAIAAERDLLDFLALWRGEPLADVAYLDWAQPEIRRLDELRTCAVVDLAAARLAQGRFIEVIVDLEGLVVRFPCRERAWMLLAVALCRVGRRGDALEAIRAANQHLDEEWGLAPSPELIDLEARIRSGAAELAAQWATPFAVETSS